MVIFTDLTIYHQHLQRSASESSWPPPPQHLLVITTCPACQFPLTLWSGSVFSCIHFSETHFCFIISVSTKSARISCFDYGSVSFSFYLPVDALNFGKPKSCVVAFETLKLGKRKYGRSQCLGVRFAGIHRIQSPLSPLPLILCRS